MTATEIPLFDQVCSLLERDPQYAGAVRALRERGNGAAVIFLPADAAEPPGWKAVLADLVEAQPRLADAGVGVVAVTPPFDPPVFPDGSKFPYPLVPLTDGPGLSSDLWTALCTGDDCAEGPYVFASLFDRTSARPRKNWHKPGLARLVPEILSQLVDEGQIIYTPGSGLVLDFEHEHLVRRRRNAAREGSPPEPDQARSRKDLMTGDPDRPPIGMSFSGGGIRSGTFTLGITQALARHRFLPWVDYFASVSGGGFTAANLTALLSRRPASGDFFFSTEWERFPYNPEIEAFRTPEDLDDPATYNENRNYRDVSHRPGPNAQMAHLFKKANYLIPRLGLATRDLLRGLGALLPGMGFTLLMFLLAVAAAASLHYFAAALVAPAVLGDTVVQPGSQRLFALLFSGPSSGGYGPGGVFLDLLIAGAASGFLVYGFLVAQYSYPIARSGRRQSKPAGDDDGPDAEEAAGSVPAWLQLRYAGWLVVFLATGGLAWYGAWELNGGGILPALPLRVHPGLLLTAGLPAALWALDRLLVTSLRAGRERAGEVKLGAIFPHPRTMLPMIVLFILQTAFVFTVLWQDLDPAGLLYPAALAIAGVLLLLLTNRVVDHGIIDWPRWATAAIIIVLAGLGWLLVFPGMMTDAPAVCAACSAWTLLAAAAAVLILLGLGVARHRPDFWGRFGLDRWERYDRFVLKSVLGFEIGALLLALVLARAKAGDTLADRPFWIWTPVVFLAGVLAVFTLIRLVVTGRRETWGSARFRTMIWAVIGMKTYVVGAAALFGLLAVPHMLSIAGEEAGSPAVPLTTALISGLWAVFLARFSGKETSGEGLLTRLIALPAGIRNAVLGLLVVVLWVSLGFLAETALDTFLPDPLQALGAGLIALGLLLMIGILLNYNYLSPHYFFGDRIVDVFLRTDHETPDGQVVILRDETRYALRSICQRSSSAPYHLVVAAINLAGSGHLQDRDRKSRHFIFSREFVGSNATGYVRTSKYRGGSTRYGSTIALSGAAVSPGIGTFTFFAEAFMLTLFNVRLGQWWLNPAEYAQPGRSDDELQKLDEFETKAFWPLYLLDEAFARTTARRKLVNLTDGGHTRDNTSLYPLFERRCRIIIAGDASQDAACLCPDLFSVIHYARIDLGVEVEIDISRLKPAGEGDKDRIPGMSESHIAVGRIRYPAVYRRDGSLKHPEERGWLVYVKPAVSKAMPAEIIQFWETDKVMFPHPTTADQFFSERQFEAQRRLGEESIRLSLLALRDAYRSELVRDVRGVKTRFLRAVMDDGVIDYTLLARHPGLLDVLLRDLMNAVSPLGRIDPADDPADKRSSDA